MKRFLITFAALGICSFLAACDPGAANKTANGTNNAITANTNTNANPAAVEADVKKLVNDVGAALGKNDADALDRMYADNYMLVDVDGSVKTKAVRLAELRSGEVKFESLVYEDISVRTNPEGTGAVVIAKAMAKGVSKGRPIGGEIRVTQVWSKTKDGWRAVSGHATQIAGGAAVTKTPASNTAAATKPAATPNTTANTNRANMNVNR